MDAFLLRGLRGQENRKRSDYFGSQLIITKELRDD